MENCYQKNRSFYLSVGHYRPLQSWARTYRDLRFLFTDMRWDSSGATSDRREASTYTKHKHKHLCPQRHSKRWFCCSSGRIRRLLWIVLEVLIMTTEVPGIVSLFRMNLLQKQERINSHALSNIFCGTYCIVMYRNYSCNDYYISNINNVQIFSTILHGVVLK
jgi:hypothetical protein